MAAVPGDRVFGSSDKTRGEPTKVEAAVLFSNVLQMSYDCRRLVLELNLTVDQNIKKVDLIAMEVPVILLLTSLHRQ